MTTAELHRPLPSRPTATLRTWATRVPAVTVAGVIGLVLAILGQIIPAGVVLGGSMGLLASDQRLRQSWLGRFTLTLLGIVALGAGEALDWFGSAFPVRWTLLLAAATLTIALYVLEGALPLWRRATALVLLLASLLPIIGVAPGLRISLSVVALVMCAVGVLQQRR